jgi:hypothetical protein
MCRCFRRSARPGGNGQTTFALPNLPAAQPNGPRYCIALEGSTPTRS